MSVSDVVDQAREAAQLERVLAEARIERATRARSPVVADSYRPREYYMRRLLAGADALALAAGLIALSALDPGQSQPWSILLWGGLTVPFWIALLLAYGLYTNDMRRMSHTTVDELPEMFHAFLIGGIAMWLYFQVTPTGKIQFGGVLLFVAVASAVMSVLRTVLRAGQRRWIGTERVLFVGNGPLTPMVASKMRRRAHHGLELVGLLSPERSDIEELPWLGTLEESNVDLVLAERRIDRLVIWQGQIEEQGLLELMLRCKQLSIKVSLIPAMLEAMGPSVEIDHVEGITVLGINPPVLSRSSRMAKRGMDVVGAGFLLLVTLPMLAIIAIAVKLDSRGSVLFRQPRVGKGGEHFVLFKFRSMTADAEARRAELLAESKDEGWLHLEHDPRVTRVGRILRMTSLDELPQLWNVLRGEMSLVGPRPLIEDEDVQIAGWARGRLDLTPGVTGLWQVLGRTRIPFEEMVKLDYVYVTNWSLWGDVRLILRTVPAVLTRRGVN